MQPTKNKIPVNTTIGKAIADIRKEKGITQVELAEQIGISQKLLSHYETGRLHISAEIIISISLALDVNTDSILISDKKKSTKKQVNLRITKRMRELESFPEIKKKAILNVLDDLIRANS
ncbi:MAG: helix-turn-helix transcriptional regulator [Thermodesulfovibrionia bacterium]|nr:helix-turn-helix transcriptional regulator [Thermodesulfovibrionia bacterium]